MRVLAVRLRQHAEWIDGTARRLANLLPESEFRGRAADSFRSRRSERHLAALTQRDRLQALAEQIDRSAATLEREIEEAKRRQAEAERRQRDRLNQLKHWWGR
jgi:hypothetical protein